LADPFPLFPCPESHAFAKTPWSVFTNATESLTAIRLHLFQVYQSGHATPKDLRATANDVATDHHR
jgi:hypothetical protein